MHITSEASTYVLCTHCHILAEVQHELSTYQNGEVLHFGLIITCGLKILIITMFALGLRAGFLDTYSTDNYGGLGLRGDIAQSFGEF